MSDTLDDELRSLAERLAPFAALGSEPEYVALFERVWNAAEDIGRSWSESNLGYQAWVHPWAHMRDTHGRFEPLVLVWQKNPRPAVIHLNGACLSLYQSSVPDPSVKFRGPGTAGWLPLHEAQNLRDVRMCGHCM